MKNLFQIANGKWRFEFQENGKLTRKTFSSKTEALNFRNSFFAARKFDLSFFLSLSKDQIKDIKDAINALPQGKSLLQSVQKAWEFDSPQSLHDFLDKFLALKKSKCDAGKLKSSELAQIKGRILNFKSAFNSFADATPQAILTFLLQKGRNKTVKNWRATISEFFSFCVNRDAIPFNPIQKIHADEFIKSETPHKIGFLSIDDAKNFLSFIEQKYPKFARFYALAMFAGIRVEEIPRMKDEYFIYNEKKIVFPAHIGKTFKAWTLEDLPDNLWNWLEKYKDKPIIRPSDWVRANSFKQFNLPKNFARHSFATYHLSLYFDPAKTSKITRNSEQMLRDHYWGALVSKDTAKQYFEILPNCKSKTENS